MTHSDILEVVRQIVAAYFDVDMYQVRDYTDFYDELGADEESMSEILGLIEEEFGCNLSRDDLPGTIGELESMVCEQLGI